jgi:hypothetical protein
MRSPRLRGLAELSLRRNGLRCATMTLLVGQYTGAILSMGLRGRGWPLSWFATSNDGIASGRQGKAVGLGSPFSGGFAV